MGGQWWAQKTVCDHKAQHDVATSNMRRYNTPGTEKLRHINSESRYTECERSSRYKHFFLFHVAVGRHEPCFVTESIRLIVLFENVR